VTLKLPATCNFCDGEVVPIPTFPPLKYLFPWEDISTS